MYHHILDPKAEEEYEQSIEFYSEKSEKATINFIDTIDQSIALICKNPFTNKKKYKNY